MKPEQLYQNLKDVAEKLGITVSDQNLKTAGIAVQSGFCTVKGQKRFVMDKHLSVYRKNRLLAEFLGQLPIDAIYLVPAVREFIERHMDQGS
jgi:hypothetical protein